MEYPISFFLKMAWAPDAMTPAALAAYPAGWARSVFGAEHADAVGDLVTRYGMYAARRKPELINEDSFRLGVVTREALDGGEFGAMVDEWDALEARMLQARARLRPDQLDAYFQLVEHPIAAVGNLYRLYYATAWNRRLASSNDARANYFADEVERLFRRDAELTEQYHRIAGGKWDGMMAQVHMNYVIWNDPTAQTMPSIVRVGGDTPREERAPRPAFAKRAAAPSAVIAIDATAYSRAHDAAGLTWTAIPALGRTGGAMLALPQGRAATTTADAVSLEYDVTVRKAGPGELTVDLAPTLDTVAAGGLKLGVSVDDGPIQTLVVELEPTGGGSDIPAKRRWAEAVKDNVVRLTARFGDLRAGGHVVKVYRLSDNVVLQKLVLATEPIAASYLGPEPKR